MIKVYDAMNLDNLQKVCSVFKISLDSLKAGKIGRTGARRKNNQRRKPKKENRQQPEPQPI